MSNEEFSVSALADVKSVKQFSMLLLELTDVFQIALHRLSETDRDFSRSGYAVLMEVYGLRTRGNILFNDSDNHVVRHLSFSQKDLVALLGQVKEFAAASHTLKGVYAMVLSVATFTVALGEDRERIVDFLFDTLSSDVSKWG